MRALRDNGLSIALILAFLVCLVGMVLSGWLSQNDQLAEHGQASIGLLTYFLSPDFGSALFENWESEFLQMASYVVMTAMLFQSGSSESKDPDGNNPEDDDPLGSSKELDAPWPVRAGGLAYRLYSYSLGIVLSLLFLASFVLHWLNSVASANKEALQHGGKTQTALEYLGSAQMWFESFQNWQSEFMATAVLVILCIVLRYRGSPEPKPVAAPHGQTGA